MSFDLLVCPECSSQEFQALHHETMTTAPCILTRENEKHRAIYSPEVREEIPADLLDEAFLFLCRGCEARYGADENQPFPAPLTALRPFQDPDDEEDDDDESFSDHVENASRFLELDEQFRDQWDVLDAPTRVLAKEILASPYDCLLLLFERSHGADILRELRETIQDNQESFEARLEEIDWPVLGLLFQIWTERIAAAAAIHNFIEGGC
jgi:hypothetical protein